MCKRDGLQFSPAESRALSAFDGILPASKEEAERCAGPSVVARRLFGCAGDEDYFTNIDHEDP